MESKRTVHLFDCDGVILNSNSLKIDALKFALISVGSSKEFINWATEEFRMNFGRSRLEHFQIFEKNNIFPINSFTSEMSYRCQNIYAKKVQALYCECEIIDETYQYLCKLPLEHSVFVVSSSDEAELKSILPKRLSLVNPVNIFGGPTEKTENIRKILESCESGKVVMYGDSVEDAQSAIKNGIYFCGLTKYSADPDSLISFCRQWSTDCFEHCLELIQ